MRKEERVVHGLWAMVMVLVMFCTSILVSVTITYAQDGSVVSEKTNPKNLNFQGYDVVYVIDNSRSVWKQQEARNQAFRNITHLAMGSDIRVGVVYFADHIYDTLALTSMETEEDCLKVLTFLHTTKQDSDNIDTNIGNAMEGAVKLFDNQDSSRKRIVILFSDGINENLNQDASYTQSANQKTQEQILKLEEMDVQIYCIYLEKTRNDEAYLQQLVNYFSDQNSYAEERFSKVKESEIDILFDKFAEVFYAMQNNMKYRKINLDSSGTVKFYVPSLGIDKLQIYLEGEIQEYILNSPKPEDYICWKDETAKFIPYDTPATGDWSIDVKSSNLDSVHGTIAYYTYLQAATELIEVQDENSQKSYQLKVHFYDKSGDEVKIDSAAAVNANVILSDAKTNPIELDMTIKDGIAKSNSFEMNSYGNYQYEIELTYEDFVDLQYSINGGEITKTAPVVYDMKKAKFSGEKTEQGIHFSIKESTLFADPEKEVVTVKEVVQLNAANPVSVEQSDGYINVTAQKASDVNFALQLEDASGMTAEVSVQGTLKNQGVTRMTGKVLIGVILFLVVLFIISRMKKSKRKKQLVNRVSLFNQQKAKFNAIYETCKKEEFKKLLENETSIEWALNGQDSIKGIVELAQNLTPEQLEEYQVMPYLQPDFKKNLLSEAKAASKIIEEAKSSVSICANTAKNVKSNSKNIKESNKSMEECCMLTMKELKRIDENYQKLKGINKNLDNLINDMGELADKIDDMLEANITCDLMIRSISGMSSVMGQKSCKSQNGSYLKGFYKFDDIMLLGYGKLGQNIGDTGIYVYSYAAEGGVVGLELRSTQGFTCRRMQDTLESQADKVAVLLKGEDYELKVKVAHHRDVVIRVSVK